MGRKGVSKRKKAKEKSAPVSGSTPSLNGRKAESQPEKVTENSKVWPKENNNKKKSRG